MLFRICLVMLAASLSAQGDQCPMNLEKALPTSQEEWYIDTLFLLFPFVCLIFGFLFGYCLGARNSNIQHTTSATVPPMCCEHLQNKLDEMQSKLDGMSHDRETACDIFRRAMREIRDHMSRCPFNQEIFIAAKSGQVWHSSRQCHHIRHLLRPESSDALKRYKSCSYCASLTDQNTPGKITNRLGTTLEDDINAFWARTDHSEHWLWDTNDAEEKDPGLGFWSSVLSGLKCFTSWFLIQWLKLVPRTQWGETQNVSKWFKTVRWHSRRLKTVQMSSNGFRPARCHTEGCVLSNFVFVYPATSLKDFKTIPTCHWLKYMMSWRI